MRFVCGIPLQHSIIYNFRHFVKYGIPFILEDNDILYVLNQKLQKEEFYYEHEKIVRYRT